MKRDETIEVCGLVTTLTVGTRGFRTPDIKRFIFENYCEDDRPVQDYSLEIGTTYQFYRVTATDSFTITSVPQDIREVGHFAGFEMPLKSFEAIDWWALPPTNPAKHLWEITISPKTHVAMGFVGIPKYEGDGARKIGTKLCVNFNNAAVQYLTYKYLRVLE